MTSALALPTRADLVELVPLVRRAATLEAATLVRIRVEAQVASAFVRLPFGVLAGRSVPLTSAPASLDRTYAAGALIEWIDTPGSPAPERRDVEWRSGLPPTGRWSRLDAIPDDVIRGLVRAGASTLKEAAAREGVPGAQPRADVADALLDSVVLTVSDGDQQAELSLRMVSALARMGFLPRDSRAGVDVAHRWLRIAGRYGAIYAERPGGSLRLA
jgi:hypothetical protein